VFNKRLAEAQSAVEQQLMRWLTDTATPDRLSLAMRHAVLGGGKRVRPFLVLETAGLFDVDRHSGLDVAAALECVHCYSLVHDDLPAMDNDRLRRGKPTVWAAYDEWTAILAGDALLTLAFEIVADGAAALPAATRIKLIGELAAAAGRSGMVGGQCLDLAAEKLAPAVSPTLDGIRRLQAMKTGAMLRFACVAGAIMGGAGSSEHRACRVRRRYRLLLPSPTTRSMPPAIRPPSASGWRKMTPPASDTGRADGRTRHAEA
jgi:farnesyl diphosphate synthase